MKTEIRRVHRMLWTMAISLATVTSFAQTKKIAFESHSGQDTYFKITLENEFFDNGESNYGGPKIKITRDLDSVIYVSDSVLVVVTTITDYGTGFHNFPAKPIRKDVVKDTIKNEPLFKGLKTVARVSYQLGSWSRWGTVTDSTVFSGFPKKKKEPEKKCPPKDIVSTALLTSVSPDDKPPFNNQMLLMLSSIMILSIAGGWISWKLYPNKLRVA